MTGSRTAEVLIRSAAALAEHAIRQLSVGNVDEIAGLGEAIAVLPNPTLRQYYLDYLRGTIWGEQLQGLIDQANVSLV